MKFRAHRPPQRVTLRPTSAPSSLRPWLPAAIKAVSGLYLRLLSYTGMRFRGDDRASALFARHYRGEIRLVVAFRHCYGMDPQLVGSSVLRGVQLPRERGMPSTPFVKFVYSSDVGWWAGALARWVLPRIGGLPIDHGRMGPASVDAIRKAIVESLHPVCLAPEGGVSYFARSVVRLEAGFARLSFLAAEDLVAQGKDQPVVVLPVSFYHDYGPDLPRRLGAALGELEVRVTGRTGGGAPWERIRDLKARLLDRAEAFYTGQFGYRRPETDDPQLALWEFALTLAETTLGLGHEGDFFLRMGRIRTAGWERQFVEPDRWSQGSALDRALLLRGTNDGWSAFRHNETAELGWWLRYEHPTATSTDAALADQLEVLADLLGRLEGGNLGTRTTPLSRSVLTTFGEPMNLTDRLPAYREHRKETLAQTVDELARLWTHDIQEADRGTT